MKYLFLGDILTSFLFFCILNASLLKRLGKKNTQNSVFICVCACVHVTTEAERAREL